MYVMRPYFLFLGLVFAFEGMAQLPDGSIAPDFTATDLDGVEHNLYDILDEGKQVILEFSATWCGPCWNYALTGTLDELHEMYGPDGTDEIRVFFIEADDTTTLADLQGTGTATHGDWTSLVNFPIIDNGGSIFNDYGGTYYPTIYTICPNRTVTESGQTDVAGHTAIFQANSCAAASLMNDPALLGYTGGTTACPGDPVNMSVELMNLGLTNLGYCTIAVMDGATEVLSYDWSGDLGTYAIENVELGTAVFDTDTDFTIEIMSTDENTANNSSSGSVVLAVDGTSLIHVEIMVDNWPQEISWSITDASGSVIESVSAGEIGGNEGDVVEWWVSAPSEGCYTFEIGDTYGDGIAGSQWGSVDGSCTVKSFTEELVYASTIYDYNGSYNFESEQAGFFVDPSLLTIGCTDSVACNFAPSATEDDGSCEYDSCAGCTDSSACNYDAGATIEDNALCNYPDLNGDCDGVCSDETACNFILDGTSGFDPLYSEGFEGFAVGDYVSDSPVWSTWDNAPGSLTDAQITDEQAHEGANSLKIYAGSPAGGPMDVIMTAGLNGDIYDCSFWMYIPTGATGYFNLQEDQAPGVGWAYEVTFAGDGSMIIVADAVEVGSGSFPLDTWFHVSNLMDMDSDNVTVSVDGTTVGNFMFDSPFGAINFYAAGDGVNLPTHYVDDFLIATQAPPLGSCTYPGCMDPLASNYDSSAGCSAECIYLTYDCASIGQSGWADESIGLYPEWQDAMHGVAWEGEWVFNIPSMIEEPSSGVEYAVHHIDWTAVNGLPDWVDEAEFVLGELGGASQHCIQAVGTPTAPSTHDISAVGEVFISIFGQPFSVGTQTYTAVLEVVGNPNPIPGCTYPLASNYMSFATTDDGSCIFPGCTDPEAGNYSPIANSDDGSCGEGCDPNADSSCTSDNNGDGVVNVSDLLILLGEFGGDCE